MQIEVEKHIKRISLTDVPRPRVEQVFSTLEPKGLDYGERGGFTVAGKESRWPIRFPGDPITVESSFNKEQLPFIVISLVHLTALARGMVIENSGEKIPTFRQRIVENYLHPKALVGFSEAVTESARELLVEFSKRFPNLMPAIEGMFKVAGAEGLAAVVHISDRLFNDAERKKLTKDNIKDYWDTMDERLKYGHDLFTKRHPLDPKEANRYEVWCNGEGFARELLKQAKIAAVNLVESGIPIVNFPNGSVREEMQVFVSKLTQESKSTV